MTDEPVAKETLRDLLRYDGKAELIAGRVVRFPVQGFLPSRITLEVLASLDDHAERTGDGEAFGPCLVYGIPPLPNGRESFCPDGSFHRGPYPTDPMSWIEGAPLFALEVRVREDYDDPHVEVRFAAKRADYFQAGTLAVWDVDPRARTVTLYRAADPLTPVVFGPGGTADAEPAVPGWRVAVDDLFA